MLNLKGASNYQALKLIVSIFDKMERDFLRRVTFCSYWLETATNLKNKISLAIHFEGPLCYMKLGSYSTY